MSRLSKAVISVLHLFNVAVELLYVAFVCMISWKFKSCNKKCLKNKVYNKVGRSEPRFTSTLRIGCFGPSSGAQQAPARQRGGTRGKMCSASSFLPDLLHFSNWFSAPSSLLLCLARACCVPELGRQQLILSVDVNLVYQPAKWLASRISWQTVTSRGARRSIPYSHLYIGKWGALRPVHIHDSLGVFNLLAV